MAYKQVDGVKKQLKRFEHLTGYLMRIVPIFVIVVALVWFFVLRGSGGTPPTTTASTNKPSANPEPKVANNSATAGTSNDDGTKTADSGKGLPETGPGGTLTVFTATAAAGTLFWEWRSRRARQHS